ncbi:hypothetical protein NE237_017775 [Protea cynaroides]|uniref:Uncharacterized protein n=1 Tax=Protea cynaroides TaxID=273540 RepID=A0A9Q0K8S4_9MAGN|nr:hypothetical protein NE237_017775 [Protea cynaroides]
MSLRTRTKTPTAGTLATEEKEPLIIPNASLPSSSPIQRSIFSKTLTSTANLAKHLPTGTVMAFQLLIPIFTKNGICDSITRHLTLLLLILLSVSCFLACFTDSFKSSDGQVHYGIATPKGMWVFDHTAASISSVPDLSKYKLRAVDFVHGVLTVFVFFSVALRDRNVLSCFYPQPKQEIQEILYIVPVGVGVICSLLFVIFPATRHGIGYPSTPGT